MIITIMCATHNVVLREESHAVDGDILNIEACQKCHDEAYEEGYGDGNSEGFDDGYEAGWEDGGAK